MPLQNAASASLETDLGKPTAFNVAMTQEHIAEGQRVEEYRLASRLNVAECEREVGA
jgi:hypothetical protein